ncbi:Signal recognition particle protein [compost metagenome]
MTSKERKNPQLVSSSSSRKKRIANGSGTSIQELNKLLKGFEAMRKQMKQFKGLTQNMKKGKKGKNGLFGNLPFLK